MPSPFPGMDPYLEDPARFPGLHAFLISGLAANLNRLLPRSYVASVQARLYVEQSDRPIYPDTCVLKRSGRTPPDATKAAVALASDPAWNVGGEPDPTREGFIDIILAGDDGHVITTIEILSPTNKTGDSGGRKEYQKKQREVLGSSASLIEIDLLRSGTHTVAAPLGNLVRRGHYDYLVCLSRGDHHDGFTVWARTVRERLPRFLVPLANGDADVVVDFQDVFDRAYDDGAFERFVEYSRPPTVPLSPSDGEWAKEVLREYRLRNE